MLSTFRDLWKKCENLLTNLPICQRIDKIILIRNLWKKMQNFVNSLPNRTNFSQIYHKYIDKFVNFSRIVKKDVWIWQQCGEIMLIKL